MKITREINGEQMTFKLTSQEMQEAYYEQEALFIEADCRERITSLYEEQIEADETLFDELLPKAIAYYDKYRSNDDAWSSDLTSAVMEAYRDVIQ